MCVFLSREQVRRVDRLAIERYGMTGLVLMENAGRGAADVLRRRFGDPGAVVIFCGPGNNGGDGCVVARHLHNAGWAVRVVLCGDANRLAEDMAANLRIVRMMQIEVNDAATWDALESLAASIGEDEIVVDALLGTGFRGRVRPPLDRLVGAINDCAKRAGVALDLPTGLDCDTGVASQPTFAADLTITFVARKIGFANPAATRFLGEIEVVDIGAPASLIREVASSGA
jgi:NAD(P)H-hydrate epimerase